LPLGTADAPAPSSSGTDTGSATGTDTDSDAALIARLRAGDDGVVETLFERHHRAALGYARSLGGLDHRAEDLASEAFVRTLAAVRAGSGPTDSWRPYLLTVVRNTAAAWATSDRRSFPTDAVQDWADEAEHALSPDQILAASAEHELIVAAFRSLPERWQSVLWHSVVEDLPAEKVALLLGLSASGVSSLAARAREGLRTAYLTAHLSRAQSAECRAFSGRLAAQVRGSNQRRSKALVRHLDECPDCRRCDEELQDVNRRLRLAAVAFVGPWPVVGAAAPPFVPPAGAGPGPSNAPPPHHAPPAAGSPAGSSKVVVGALATGTVVLAALVLTPLLLSSPPERPSHLSPPGPARSPTDGEPDRPIDLATVTLPPVAPPSAAPPAPGSSPVTAGPGSSPAPTKGAPSSSAAPSGTAPPSAAGRSGSPSATAPSPRPSTGPTAGRSGGLSASVLSASTPVAPLPGDRRVRLRLAGPGTCGEIEDRETSTGLPFLTPCTGSEDQVWIVRADRSGGVQLIGAANSACLEAAGTAGAAVAQQVCDGSARQSWQLVDLTGGESALRHRSSGLLLAAEGTGKVDEILQLRAAGCTSDPACRPAAAFRL
ncbi:sigma-70 family RNA polymerase sigma factor, partial [Streptomyces sp. XY431]|uniref:sigma-70 family RNA polymerase sigma factor n=1 Tax=Streptomyces sp. XY431 TaxID=1415562 RepID=UPI0006B06B95